MTETIDISPPTQEARKLWATALELAREFGADERWALVGGLMVQLHAFEHSGRSRLTTDIDFLGDSRQRPSMTESIAEILVDRGGQMAMPPRGDERLGYKFNLGGTIIEVLGSDGVRRDPRTVGRHTTFQVPGGTQALARSEIVRVSLDGGEPIELRRPNLLGAILIKARVVAKQRDKFESDRQDLIRLLSFVADPRALAEDLKPSEKKWLRRVTSMLAFDDPALDELFPRGEARIAEQAFRLLASSEN